MCIWLCGRVRVLAYSLCEKFEKTGDSLVPLLGASWHMQFCFVCTTTPHSVGENVCVNGCMGQ